MNILVIGGGGREHALVWKLSQSPHAGKICCAPGNAGISRLAQCVDIPSGDGEALLRFARDNRIDLTVVGPEAPLAGGIVDQFQEEGLKIFGPTRNAAQLESSKAFAKEFCARHRIPTAYFQIFDSLEKAKTYLQEEGFPVVIKADGLAQGKGVFICDSLEEGVQVLEELFEKKVLGEAARRVVIEDYLEGEEVSFMAFVDGRHAIPLSSARDYKRLLDGNRGPNTGGMGAYSPVLAVNASLYKKIVGKILKPAVDGMTEEGNPFIGILYAGLMIADGNPHLLEFNVRFGDPEAQVVLPRLKTDLMELIEAALTRKLHDVKLSWETKAAVCVVMASKGYPEKSRTGATIQGLKNVEGRQGLFVFHAATKPDGDRVVVNGGRVLGVTALGKDVREASDLAYQAASQISWQESYYRKDIGRFI